MAKRKRAKTAIIRFCCSALDYSIELNFKANPHIDSLSNEFALFFLLFIISKCTYKHIQSEWVPISMADAECALCTDTPKWNFRQFFFFSAFLLLLFFYFFYFCQFQIKNRNKFTFVRSGCCCSSCYCQRKETYGKIEIEFLLRRIRCERVHTNSFRNSPGIYLYLTYLASIWFECDISWRTKLTHVV